MQGNYCYHNPFAANNTTITSNIMWTRKLEYMYINIQCNQSWCSNAQSSNYLHSVGTKLYYKALIGKWKSWFISHCNICVNFYYVARLRPLHIKLLGFQASDPPTFCHSVMMNKMTPNRNACNNSLKKYIWAVYRITKMDKYAFMKNKNAFSFKGLLPRTPDQTPLDTF